jgi:hypothetical protein
MAGSQIHLIKGISSEEVASPSTELKVLVDLDIVD